MKFPTTSSSSSSQHPRRQNLSDHPHPMTRNHHTAPKHRDFKPNSSKNRSRDSRVSHSRDSRHDQAQSVRSRDKNSLDFAIDVAILELIEVALGKQKNVVCSPLSLTSAINLLVPGTKGRTLEQLLSLLKAESVEELNSRTSNFMQVGSSYNNDNDEDNMVALSNAVFYDEKLRMKPQYHDAVKKYLQASVVSLDFSNKEEAERRLNEGWSSSIVNERMRKLLPPIKLPMGDLSLVLANILYFRGDWAYPFDKCRTRDDKFYLLDGETSNVPFMQKVSSSYEYAEFLHCQILKLPYKTIDNDSRKFSMLIILPNDRKGLPDLLARFKSNPKLFCHPRNLRSGQEVDLKLPKFKFSYEFFPDEEMKELGLTLPWNGNETTDIFCGDIRCPLSTVIQSTMIEVNEKGTEFISRTLMYYGCASHYKPKPIEFVGDHPFIFMIKEDVSELVLGVGAVLNPLMEN